MRRRVGVLFSGRGSNLRALLNAASADPGYPAHFVSAIANVDGAPGLAIARDAGLRTCVVPHAEYGRDREAHERALDRELRAQGVELVVLAGYLRKLTPFFVHGWAGAILNIHPSLLPAFPGLSTHARALAAGCKLHGCTVHLVTDELDAGPVLAQAGVPVLPGDTEETLAARVLAQEHRLYPAALAAFINGGGRAAPADAALLNPMPIA